MNKKYLSILIVLFLGGCATHPTIGTTRMEPQEKRYGWSWAAENFFPYFWGRYGLSEKSDIGVRLGPFVYGTGIDYSRILYSKEHKWDVVNLAWSFNPNYNTDFTYYKFKQRKPNNNNFASVSWWGMRMMLIANGISGGSSSRVGFLLGGQPNEKWGYEVGYYHDFNSIPITNLFDFNWNDTVKNNPIYTKRYSDTPHTDPASGMPTEYSRLTGLSLRLFFNIQLSSASKSSG